MKKYQILWVILFTILSSLVLAGCGGAQNKGISAIEAYIQALVEQDANQLAILSCADWEASAQIELDSFTAVSAKLEGLSCQETGQEGDDILVSCNGMIVLDYNGEIQELDLSTRTYRARQEGGEWRMCGYR